MACRDDNVDTKSGYVEILRFRHFVKHVVFTGNGEKCRNKELKKYIDVSVVVDLVCGNTKKIEYTSGD